MNYLSEWGLYERLKACYDEYGGIIIAYDIDDTVRPFRSEEEPCRLVRELLIRARNVLNAQFIVFTANKYPDKVMEYIKANNLPCDFFNTNATLVPATYYNPDKIYYHILLDDKCGLANSYKCLKRLVDEKEVQQK